MCLIAVAWQAHPRYRLALIANRDEFHGRPAAPAAHDPQRPDIYGGRDLQAGGSWLLASTRGRLAAVTNVRVGLQGEAAPRSRGALVLGFVESAASSSEFVDALAPIAAEHGRYNLLMSTPRAPDTEPATPMPETPGPATPTPEMPEPVPPQREVPVQPLPEPEQEPTGIPAPDEPDPVQPPAHDPVPPAPKAGGNA